MDYKDIIKQIDETESKFGSVIDDAQKRMLREVLILTKDLALSNGRILPTVGNLKIISNIKNKLNKAVLNKDYLSGVKDLLKSFEAVQGAQIGYFNTISEGQPTKTKYDLVRGMAIENTAAQLTESGIDANVTSKLKDMLLRSVTSGSLYSDLVGEVSEFLSDTDKSPGALSRYAKTYTTTALNQFAGQTNKLITEDSGAEWFRYVGSDIETTREFCDLMTDKEYFHKSEIPELLKGHIDGKKCEIYDKTGLPKGMIEGTNKDNFQVNVGGWNCRHAVVPVLTFTVPKKLRDKFEKGETKFEPAKTIDEAIAFAKNKIGIKNDTAKLSLNARNEINNVLSELTNQYKSTLISFTSIKQKNVHATSNSKEMSFNSDYYDDYEKFKKIGETQSFLKYNVFSENPIKSSVSHEFAHSLTIRDINLKTPIGKELTKVYNDFKKDRLNYKGENQQILWKDNISLYASKNVHEFTAEAFAQAKTYSPDKVSKYSKQVLEIINKNYSK